MIDGQSRQVDEVKSSSHLWVLAILAILSASLYGVISLLSWRFDYNSPTTERPIVVVVLLFAVALVGYLFAIRLVARVPQSRRLLTLIVWAAVLFRVILLFSVPIQEIDIYRYLWDGSVSAAGVSPFRYSPEQVRVAPAHPTADLELSRLARLRDRQPALAEVLHRIHFGELPTIYPATSQVVFAAASLTTPSDASIMVRVFIMKAWFIGFDLATLFLVIALLKQSRMPVGLCVIYAWCPLLLKEVANSGHLDAVAVFLTTLAVYLAARILAIHGDAPRVSLGALAHSTVPATLASVVLALAVGAKLYPIVIAPLLFLVLAKRLGWYRLAVPVGAFAVTTFLVLWPMLPRERTAVAPSPGNAKMDSSGALVPPPVSDKQANDPSLGVATFLRRWEMNDFIFLVLVENFKPMVQMPPDRIAWFSFLPESARQQMVETVSTLFKVPQAAVPFYVARAVTAMVFLGLAMVLAWRAAQKSDIASLCEAGFLTLAWFWLLCPTQNPWYWTWALPLLPFARSRAWLAVSGLVMLYYLRFWFIYHWPDTLVLGTRYVGYAFFDYIVTWIEFAPWFVWLAIESFRRYRRRLPIDQASPPLRMAEDKASAG